MKIEQALTELRKSEGRKFEQGIDLIINLRKYDLRKNTINIFVSLPHKINEKKICGFLENKSSLIDTISKVSFASYKEKKDLKKLVKKYDFFISSAANMPAVATSFGRALGPAGKMPSPKLGIIVNETEKDIQEIIRKINSVVRVQTKEPTIKLLIGKEKMKDEQIIDNIKAVYTAVLNELPNNKDNIKSVMVKLTMSKPIKVEM